MFRVYEMFIGPFDQDAPWDMNGIEGVKRFLEKVWRIFDPVIASAAKQSLQKIATSSRRTVGASRNDRIDTLLHQTIKKVTDDIGAMHFNTAVSAMMIFVNEATDEFVVAIGAQRAVPLSIAESFLKILAPFAPHLTEELWHRLGHTTTIHRESWPTYDPKKIVAETFELVVQVNGKVRDRLIVASNISEQEAATLALA